MFKRASSIFLILVFTVGTSSAALAEGPIITAPPVNASHLAVKSQDLISGVARELRGQQGEVQVVVRLTDAPLAAVVGRDAKHVGSAFTATQQKDVLQALDAKQSELLAKIGLMGGKQLGRVTKALNAVIVSVNASKLSEIAALPNVDSIRPVVNYEIDLAETVPYVGAQALQVAGVDGTGVRVAVLDSGIDYTHHNLGGSGVVADFNGNNPTTIEAGTFPTSKVVGGYDFVGEGWPNTDLAPDPDPLDKGAGAGHGTHVADIIGGKSANGLHVGVAPGASLYAVGVCSKVSTSCSGVALLQGMDYALDPNGDNDISDAVDVINLSLGSSYGQRQDDLGAACANAVHVGVVVVASAGNSADKPYIVGSPSTTPEVISVAQTQVPSAVLYRVVAGAVTAGGSYQPWSAAPALVSGALQYGNGAGVNLNGCAAFAAGSLTGKILLVDRGSCDVSSKVSNGAAAGARAVIVANNAAQAPGDLPPDFSFGSGTPTVAGYSITKADGMQLKTVLGQTATIDPATAAGLVGNMVSSSSRGPSSSFNAIKPDVGAPGASVSAVYGTGNGQMAFGGTSGAAPMVAGSVALIIQKFPGITPLEVKARLMNTGDTNIGINPVGLPGVLAPITRIGGGEVRVDRAVETTTAAWDAVDRTGSLSFGYRPMNRSATFVKKLVVRNYSNVRRRYRIQPGFRYADDAASGAVTITATPSTLNVRPKGSATVTIRLKVNVARLPIWTLNGGAGGGDGYRLQDFEFDGYVAIKDAVDDIHVAWQVLPHRAVNVKPEKTRIKLRPDTAKLKIKNAAGALDGRVDVFALLGTSPQLPPSVLPGDGDNYAVVDLKNFGARLVDIGGGQFGLQFAVNTWEGRAHPNYPAEFDVYLDTNMDGIYDFVVYNQENAGFGTSGQNVVRVVNLSSNANAAYNYIDADLNSRNAILTAPLSALGLTPATQFKASVYALDNYFTGAMTDSIEGMTFTAAAPRYTVNNEAPIIPKGRSYILQVAAPPGGAVASPAQSGILLMNRDARPQGEAHAIFVTSGP